jgi:hypothetical protein
MSEIERYDVLVVGERRKWKVHGLDNGESWPSHRGDRAQADRWFLPERCLPAKQEHHSQCQRGIAREAGEEFGLELGSVRTNMPGVQRRKREMVEAMIQNHLDRYKASGAELIMGTARFVAPNTVRNGGSHSYYQNNFLPYNRDISVSLNSPRPIGLRSGF